MAFEHNSKLAENEPDWGDVDKTKLPLKAHANMDSADKDKKSEWSYPHHFIKNGGKPNDDGVYTTGTMYLHEGGLNAAWAAANGARSGKEASGEIKEHLQKHRKALGKTKEQKEKDQLLEVVDTYYELKDCLIAKQNLETVIPVIEKNGITEDVTNLFGEMLKTTAQESVEYFNAILDEAPHRIGALIKKVREGLEAHKDLELARFNEIETDLNDICESLQIKG